MNEIDVFKLAEKLGFDVRGAELNNKVNSMVLLREKKILKNYIKQCNKITLFYFYFTLDN